MIYIVNKHNKPLMPTNRHSHIRKLIKQGKAVVINSNPFIVKLKYETADVTQPLYCGIDTGRENIGLGVSDERGNCVAKVKVITNNKTIKIKMDERRAHRKERHLHKRQRKQRKALRENNIIQSKNKIEYKNKEVPYIEIKVIGADELAVHKIIKGAESKFNNRKRSENWLTPSARQLIWCHITAFNKLRGFLPIDHLTLEAVTFDFQKLDNHDIKDWNHGKLFSFRNANEYIKHKQHGKCAVCGKPIEHIHHIVSRSEGGSNSPDNLIGLCKHCHDEVHKDKAILNGIKGKKQQYKVSLLNTVMPFLIEEFKNLTSSTDIEFKVCDGYDTYLTREKYGIDKDHSNDGYAISLFDREIKSISDCSELTLRRFKKKSNNNIAKLGQREYYLNGKLVAVNRHKSMCQKCDSFEEFSQKYSKYDIGKIKVKPAKRIYTAHKKNIVSGFHPGDVVRYEKHNKIKGNVKQDVFPIVSVDIVNQSLYCTATKNRQMKYCQRIKSGAIQFI